MSIHNTLELAPMSQGFHLITDKVVDKIGKLPENGLLNLFVKHTSAGITLNENADPDVRRDFHRFINDMIPESYPHFRHTLEGSDDMPAHIKASLLGQSLQIPVQNGRLALGTWQGIYFCEFRKNAGPRSIILTIIS
ncbi:MAG: secondary thiamine-phosphate synthase enzyme YjbQ [Bacteroidota bacterium]